MTKQLLDSFAENGEVGVSFGGMPAVAAFLAELESIGAIAHAVEDET